MTKQIDLTQQLSDEDKAYLEARGDVTSLRVNSAIVEGKDYVVQEPAEVPSTEELSAQVAAQMVEDQKRIEEGDARAAERRDQLEEERLADLRARAEAEVAQRQDERAAAQGQATPVASKTAAQGKSKS
jgi:hypothetical protein